MTPPHRKTDDDGDHTSERAALSIGPDMPLRMQFITLCTIIGVSLAAGAWCWNVTRDMRELRDRIDGLAGRPDPWTGTNMYTYAAITKEWNPSMDVPNPLDIQANRRVTKIKLPDVTLND